MLFVDRDHLAIRLGIPLKKLTYLLYVKGIDNCYTRFDIIKKDGSLRTISAPIPELKDVLKSLAELLYEEQKEIWIKKNICPNISHGFERNKNIITNAKLHRNKRIVLNLDLENFFESFHFGRVRGFFHKNSNFNLDINVATLIAQLCCYNGSLPQGAPTSPIITNLICQILDFRVLHLAKKFRLDYTRYADDLTFSTNDKFFLNKNEKFINEITELIEKSGFTVNEKKTRLLYKDSKQTVTGLVVNEKLNVDSRYYRLTKAMAHSLYTKGEFYIDGEIGTLNQLEGRFSFINAIDRYDNINCSDKKRNFATLNGREKQYKRFLFYRLFLCNDMPLIVTEGKTDPIYLKAALKKHYERYPELVNLNDSGKFEFKIHFFKRSEKIKYFFGISEYGGDAINRLYNAYFEEKKNKSNFELFNKYKVNPKNPTILIYDNETKTNKPLKKFIEYSKMSSADKKLFQNELIHRLSHRSSSQSNLYLLTNPLKFGKDECEIEDLFEDEVLDTILDGKTFDRTGEKSVDKYYGKMVFARYIMDNYHSIDFTNFLPMLDKISEVVKEYR